MRRIGTWHHLLGKSHTSGGCSLCSRRNGEINLRARHRRTQSFRVSADSTDGRDDDNDDAFMADTNGY